MTTDGPNPARPRPGRPSLEEAGDTRRRIILGAQRLFGQRGYAGVTMGQLAQEAGVNARAIYHYFSSKRALFEAVTATTLEEYAAQVLSMVLVHGDVRTRLHGFVDLYRVLYRTNRPALSFLTVVLVEAIAGQQDLIGTAGGAAEAGEATLAINAFLVDDALAAGQLAPVDRDGALALLQTIGMGLGMASLDDDRFLPMLDALDHLIDGTLFLRS